MICHQIVQVDIVLLPHPVDPSSTLRMHHGRVELRQPRSRLQVGADRTGIRAHDNIGLTVVGIGIERANPGGFILARHHDHAMSLAKGLFSC